MLLDRDRQLLTAYVDGEMTSRQRRHVVRLLHRSEEARQLLRQLKADARALRQLTVPPLPADLTGPVLHLIAERHLAPEQQRIIKVPAVHAWIGPLVSWAAAAVVLLALGVASYLYFVASLDQPPKTELAELQWEQLEAMPQLEEPGPSIAPTDAEKRPAARISAEPKINRPPAIRTPKVVQRREDKAKPNLMSTLPAPPKEETALTDRVETFQFDRVQDLLPVVVKLSDLDRLPARKKLFAELQKDNAFRVELPCPNGTKAFERVQKAARTQHIGLIVDKPAQERIKVKWKISYVLYLENVTPEELTEFVRQIDVEDHKSAAGKPAEVQLDRLVLSRLNAGHRKELSALLGVDPITTIPSGADPSSSLSDATARRIGQSAAGQGGTRSEPGKPSAQSSENTALVLAYHPVRPSPGSDEIKHFLETRKPARPGTIRVLLVLRGS